MTASKQSQDGTSAECTVKTPDDGQRRCPKHVVLWQNKVGSLVHLVCYLKRNVL